MCLAIIEPFIIDECSTFIYVSPHKALVTFFFFMSTHPLNASLKKNIFAVQKMVMIFLGNSEKVSVNTFIRFSKSVYIIFPLLSGLKIHKTFQHLYLQMEFTCRRFTTVHQMKLSLQPQYFYCHKYSS